MIRDDMKSALAPMFKLADPDDTGYPTLLIDGDYDAGTVSMLLSNSIVIDANYSRLEYNDTTNMWWVNLTDMDMHDDPDQFETAEDES
jgi:hypothetical protein